MIYLAIPSLEHIALIKTTTALWLQYDIRLMGNGWNREDNCILKKVPELQLTKSLENKVLNCVDTIGLEILKWMQFHEIFYLEGILHRESLNQLCWTPQGTVDKRKTAEILIKYENLEISLRYKLACIYCLENDILTLWNKLSESDMEHFYSLHDPRCLHQPEVVLYWTYYIKGEDILMDLMIKLSFRKYTRIQYVFNKAVENGNKVATEYFFQKLNPMEREKSLENFEDIVSLLRREEDWDIKHFDKIDYADVLYFFLSQMNDEQQIKMIQRYSSEVLKCFLDWPWQSLFLETAILIGDILPQREFSYMLDDIIDKIKKHKDYNYQKLFQEFWQQSSISHKEYVVKRNCARPLLITNLIDIGAPEIIKLIIDCANTAEIEAIILSDGVGIACERLIYADRWGKLKLFVHECISSKDILFKFKDMMKKQKDRKVYNLQSFRLQEGKETWTKLFELLDDLIQKSDGKRNLEEVNSGKRLCI